MGEVIELPRPRTVEDVLNDAHLEELQNVIVVGETPDGSTYISTSIPDAPLIMFLLLVAKRAILDSAMPEVEE